MKLESSVDDDSRGGRRFRDADRGQLLLVSGLVVAVSLVALVVLLNASIYSENVATRGIEAADGEVLEVRAAAVEETGKLIDGTNRNRPADHDAAVADGITELDAHMSRAYADRGGVTHVELRSLQNGSYVTGNLSENATLAAGVNRTRGFRLTLNASTIENTTRSQATNESFHVTFSNSTGATAETREVYAYENKTDGNITLAVGANDGDPTVVCDAPIDGRDSIEIDLTSERLWSERCPGIWSESAGSLNGSYDVGLASASAADGTVTATVRPRIDDVDTDLTVSDAIYAARIDLRYRTAELRFETTIRVAPGEPDA